jgi:hypothetical protein
MTQFTYMAIKVADEDQFNQVAEKLREQGYEADGNPFYSTWSIGRTHVITYENGKFSLHPHSGTTPRIRYTFEQFMKL